MFADLRFNSETEDEERNVAKIANLLIKIKRLYERESRAKRQAREISELYGPKLKSDEIVRKQYKSGQ